MQFDDAGVTVDIQGIYADPREREEPIAVENLEGMAYRLERMFLDGLDGAGDDRFDTWLTAEREDVRVARADVLRRLATHPGITPMAADKWFSLWADADPCSVDAYRRASSAVTVPMPNAVDARWKDRPEGTRRWAKRPSVPATG